ncbi:MAG: glycosyltransferase family 2 protein [Bacilli bacterium]
MSDKKDLFTIILTNYNQENFIYNAIDSIIKQKHKNIELIISDDFSKKFDSEKIRKYINEKSNNITNLRFVVNDSNIGTVKTINKCLKISSGKYITIFAADDELNNENVINNYLETFSTNIDIKIVASICGLYDYNISKKIRDFPDKKEINRLNKMNAQEQNYNLRIEPIFAPGATAYRADIFKELNYFDEKYVLIEDWPWFLKCTRNNYKVRFAQYYSLNHRGGGISEEKKLSNKIANQLIKDTNNIYKTEIFPYIKSMDLSSKTKILKRYKIFVKIYKKTNLNILLKYYMQCVKNGDILINKLTKHKKIFLELIIAVNAIIISLIIKYFWKNSIIIICILCPIIFRLLLFVYNRKRRRSNEKNKRK